MSQQCLYMLSLSCPPAQFVPHCVGCRSQACSPYCPLCQHVFWTFLFHVSLSNTMFSPNTTPCCSSNDFSMTYLSKLICFSFNLNNFRLFLYPTEMIIELFLLLAGRPQTSHKPRGMIRKQRSLLLTYRELQTYHHFKALANITADSDASV